MNKLTIRQQETYDYIIDFYKENKHFPTLREIGNDFDITVKGVWDHMDALRKKGYITWSGDARGIELMKYDIEIILHEK